jgi:hypothetical protein
MPPHERSPGLVVIQPVGDWACAECGGTGDLLRMDDAGPLCLACADLDHLVFLPAGDAALTRRTTKASSLSAVVVRWSRARKRYERQRPGGPVRSRPRAGRRRHHAGSNCLGAPPGHRLRLTAHVGPPPRRCPRPGAARHRPDPHGLAPTEPFLLNRPRTCSGARTGMCAEPGLTAAWSA